MQEVEIQFDATTKISLTADFGPVTSASVTLYAPDGSALQSPTVALPTVNTTADDGSTGAAIVASDANGIGAGARLIVLNNGVPYAVDVADVTGTRLDLLTFMPNTPEVGDPVYGATLTADIAAPGGATIGPNYRLVWVYSDGTQTKTVSQAASVVRWVWTAPIVPSDVQEILADLNTSRPLEFCKSVVDRVDESIKGKILATGRRPWLYLSSAVFADAARAGIRYELALRGIAFGGQVFEAQREARFAFDDKLQSVITGLSGIQDTNADGKISASEAKPFGYSVRVTR